MDKAKTPNILDFFLVDIRFFSLVDRLFSFPFQYNLQDNNRLGILYACRQIFQNCTDNYFMVQGRERYVLEILGKLAYGILMK